MGLNEDSGSLPLFVVRDICGHDAPADVGASGLLQCARELQNMVRYVLMLDASDRDFETSDE